MKAVAAFLKANDHAYEAAMKRRRLGTALKLLKGRADFLKAAGLLPRVAPPG